MNLPTGTVTFLFTDIEGSTRLWEQFPEAMRHALARHTQLILDSVQRHSGNFVRARGEGDSTFSVFTDPAQALEAVTEFQRALARETWPTDTSLRVRAALHTGSGYLMEGDYNSSDVNRCARLCALAHGGQTLLSHTVRDRVQNTLPLQATLLDLGLHRLKDLQQPEQVYQLCHPDLPSEFPSLNSLSPQRTNLPVHLTSFIGREREVGEVLQLLSETRLLTLTGVGGCGKTRLSLAATVEAIEGYPNGVWMVELAALSEESLVVQSVASALGLREQPGRSLIHTLVDFLQSRTLLIVLDNCEHLAGACAQLATDLLRACPNLKVLATSREALRIDGEITYRVPSLPTPGPGSLPKEASALPGAVLKFDAVRLFVERAHAHRTDFALSASNGSAVAAICERLDGIPLALELAAARVRVLSVDQIASRLEDRFRLLTGGSRTALPRQQTLRALIDWSYDLLNAQEKTLLHRLSVFAGGWTLEAAEFVCADPESLTTEAKEERREAVPPLILHPSDVLDMLTSLVDKSLVVFDADREGGGRYRQLETIWQYGRDRLVEVGESEALRRRHSEYYMALAEEAQSHLEGSDQAVWLDRLAITMTTFGLRSGGVCRVRRRGL